MCGVAEIAMQTAVSQASNASARACSKGSTIRFHFASNLANVIVTRVEAEVMYKV